ncbi:TonB-dependent receptor [bacterium]|nr:TonB-dependent receptor [bacterium]
MKQQKKFTKKASSVKKVAGKKQQKKQHIPKRNNILLWSAIIILITTVAYFPAFQNEYGGGHNGSEYLWQRDNPDMTYQDYAKTYGYNYVDGNGAGINDGWPINWGPRLDDGIMLDQWSTGANSAWNSRPDNYKNYFRTGMNVENSVAVTSNGEKASGRLAFTNLNTNGIIDFTDQKQNTINGSLTLRPTDRLTAVTNFTYLVKESQNMPNNGYSGIGVDFAWLQRDYDMSYAREMYDQQGNEGHIFPGWDNPYYTLQNTTGFKRDRLYGNFSLDYKLTDWVSVMVRAGTDFYNEYRKSIELAGKRGNIRKARGGQFTQNQYYYNESNADLMLNFDKTLGDIRLDGVLGANYRNNTSKSMTMRANDLTVPDLFTISNVKGAPVVSMYDYEKETNSAYFAANASYRNFLFFGVTGRNDWSSTLPVENSSYFYPSVSAGLILTEAFGLDSDVLSFAKLRGSWAQVGGDTGAYRLSQTYSASTFNNISMFSPGSTLPPTNLKPEITSSFEIGADLRLWQGRVSLDFTYYDQTTVNQILSVATSTTTGYRSMLINAGEIENKGVEIMANVKIFDQPDGFKWNATVNWAKNKSTVNELYGDLESYQISGGFGGCKTLGIPGQEWGVLWGLPYVYDDNGNMVVSDAGTPLTTNVGVNLGTVTPDWTGGLRNSFSYGDVSMSFLIDARMGGDFFSVTAWHAPFTGSYEGSVVDNVREDGLVADAVKEDGSINDTRVSAQQYYMGSWMWNNHEYSILDGSFVKLRELVLGYDFDVSSVNWLQGMNLSFVGRNLAILWRHESTDELGIDPEVGLGGGDAGVGFENFQIPTTRSLGFKLRVSF